MTILATTLLPMTILIDSAVPKEVARAVTLGFVRGVTTNPALVARAGMPAGELIKTLCQIVPPGSEPNVFYQLTAPTLEGRAAEAARILDVAPGRVALKIPCTTENLGLIGRHGAYTAVTTLFGAAQALASCAAGARWIIPYVDRTTRLCGDGPGFVRTLRALTDASRGPTEILAASLKSPAQAVEALLAGAHHLTLPLSVLEALGDHVLSEAAIAQFSEVTR